MIYPCSVQTNIQGEELREHGTRLFPVACYMDRLPPDEIPWHWHNELELGLVVTGSMTVEIGSARQKIACGEGFFINSNVLHSANSMEGAYCELHSIVFHTLAVSGSMDNIIWQKYVKPLIENEGSPGFCLKPETEWNRKILDSIAVVWQLAEQEEYGYEMYIHNELSKMIALLSENQSTANKKIFGKEQRDNARIKEMLTFIQANYDKELLIEDIAAACAVSVRECIRCFRATIATTPIAYLKSYRLQQAALKLQLSTEKISVIAQSCGFQEMSYFSKSFKEVYSCTPSEYRAGKQGNEPDAGADS